ALDIDLGGDAKLKEIVSRECFAGGAEADATRSQNSCPNEVERQAKQIASDMRRLLDRQLQGYLAVIKAMRAAPGLKHLVLLSDGLGVYRDLSALDAVARAAAESGVQLSVLLQEPDPDVADASPKAPQQGMLDPGIVERRRQDNVTLAAG